MWGQTVSHPVRRGQRCGFSFGERLDWTNPVSLRQCSNDIFHLISQVIVTKVAQPLLPPCSAPQQMLCWHVFPEGPCGGDVFAIHENSILLRTQSYVDFLSYYPGSTLVRSCCMGWRPQVALQIAEQTSACGEGWASASELLLGYGKLRLSHSHFVRVKILIRFWLIPQIQGLQDHPCTWGVPFCLIILKGALSWFPSGQIPSWLSNITMHQSWKTPLSLETGGRMWCPGVRQGKWFSFLYPVSSLTAILRCVCVCVLLFLPEHKLF